MRHSFDSHENSKHVRSLESSCLLGRLPGGPGTHRGMGRGPGPVFSLGQLRNICHLTLLPSLYQILSSHEKCPKLGTNTSSSVLSAAHFIFRPSASALWTSCVVCLLVFCLLIELSEAPWPSWWPFWYLQRVISLWRSVFFQAVSPVESLDLASDTC